jgi:hypothetical protein
MLGPLLGGFMAGNIFNLGKRLIIMMETYDPDTNNDSNEHKKDIFSKAASKMDPL